MSKRATAIYDIAVIGAGVAGLTAARSLAEAGSRVLLLEARDRIGGRILTVRDGNTAIELGAEFVHGRPPELLGLLAEAGLSLIERDGSMVRAQDGKLHASGSEGDDDDQPYDAGSDASAPSEGLRVLAQANAQSSPDQSFAAWVTAQRDLDDNARESMTGYVEGFNAADAHVISIHALGVQQAAEDAIEGDRVFHIRGGYDQLTDYQSARAIAAGASIRLRSPVNAIEWQPGGVTLMLAAEQIRVRRAVIAVPLSSLQQNEPCIDPAPRSILAAAGQMRMGAACRFTLLFRQRFWRTLPHAPELRDLGFLLAFQSEPPVWWTTAPERDPTLTGWFGGPRSQAILGQTAGELAKTATQALAALMGVPVEVVREQLRTIHTHNWSADPYARGAYSYVAVGGSDASQRMSEPVEHTLFFAGEHTDTTGHWGTVHGAMRSGLRAAAQVLAAQRDDR